MNDILSILKTKGKELIMTLVVFAVSYYSDNSDGNVSISYILVMWLSMTLGYLSKNVFIKSTSELGKLNWKDMLSGGLMAVSAAVGNFAAILLTDEVFTWTGLIKAIVAGFSGYIGVKFMSNSKGQLLKK